MITIQFYENKSLYLSQIVKSIPSVDEEIKIKGRKGKVLSVKEVKENLYHVHVSLEKVSKNSAIFIDPKKKKR